ncbi:MAG: hypothetical protein KDI88_05885 [Gammaproteobacteria bacterium]|nr:hypothetical protein [Gammaproteobacteria bacterium]
MSRNTSFGCWLLRYLALMLVGFALYEAHRFPVFSIPLVVGLSLYALVLAIEVRAWLLVLPTAIAVLSIGFWSGRYFWDAFDLFMLVTLAGGLWCCRVFWPAGLQVTRLWPLALFAVVQLGITLNGLYPLEAPVPGLWADYFASTNALREAKGVAWALLLVPMLMQAQRIGAGTMRWLVAGMALGLMALFLAILWERNLYTGILNFASRYRVSGWFFDLHTGGAAIDIALAMMLPFLLGLSLWWRKWPVHLVTAGLLVLAAYGLLVTFSRANYLAVAIIGLVLLAGLLTLPGIPRRGLRRWAWAPALAVVAVVAIVPVVVGGTILERFRSTAVDIQIRLDHWSESAGLVAPGVQTLYGIGKGAFPRHYHLGRALDGETLSTLFLHGTGTAAFVRINASDDAGLLDLRQRFRPRGSEARLHLVLRTPAGHRERLLVEFCERQVLRVRAECRWVGTNIPDTEGEWREYVSPVRLSGLGEGGWLQRSPVDISILNRGIKNGIDVKSVRLVAADGSELLHNTNFARGLDRWYMVDGNHLRWHVKNIFVFSYVEGGWIGLLTFVLVALVGLLRAWRLHRQGDPAGLLFFAAIAGGLAIGLFDSVLDAPRVAVLFLLPLFASLVWTAEPVDLPRQLRRWL